MLVAAQISDYRKQMKTYKKHRVSPFTVKNKMQSCT